MIGTGDAMPANTQANGGLWIILRDPQGEIAREHASDGEHAIRVAIFMLAHVPELKVGDIMRVVKDPDRSARLVELP